MAEKIPKAGHHTEGKKEYIPVRYIGTILILNNCMPQEDLLTEHKNKNKILGNFNFVCRFCVKDFNPDTKWIKKK